MKLKAVIATTAVALTVLTSGQALSEAKPIEALTQTFVDLPISARQYTGPLFWLHGDESKEQIEGELMRVLESGNGTFTAESRPHSDWLGEGWYRDLKICLDFARAHHMTMWIFDEKWWPSGEVGGTVPPKYSCRDLIATAIRASGPGAVSIVVPENLVAVIAGKAVGVGNTVDPESLIDLTPEVRDGRLAWDAPAGDWRVMTFSWKTAGTKRGHKAVVNGLDREAIDWWINTVYQPHYDRFRDDFGRTIQGYFYDEPETLGDFGPDLIPAIQARGGDWMKALVAYKFKLAGEQQVPAAYLYQETKAELWGKTMYGGVAEWCRAHGVRSIGHFLEHSWEYLHQDLNAGNMFQLQKYSDMGAIDEVFKQILPGKRPMKFWQMAKLGSSISHVYGKQDDLAMVEIFGARGQDLGYPEMKWLTDQMHVRGANFFIPHSFNPRGPWDKDCPPYFYNGGFEPRYPLYRIFADYTSRLTLLFTGGRHVAPVAQLYLGNSAHFGKAIMPEQMTTALQDALLDMDWMPYDVLENDVKIEGKELALYRERYKVLIVPPVEVIPYATLARVKEFYDAGGIVVGYGFLPSVSATMGKDREDIAALTAAVWGEEVIPGLTAKQTNAAGGRSYLLPLVSTPEQIQQALTGDAGIHPTLEVVEGRTNGWVHVLHRVKDGMDRFLIANQEIGGGVKRLKMRITATGEPEAWDPLRNEISRLPYQRLAPDLVEITLDLAPYQSIVIVFAPEKRDLPALLGLDAKPVRAISITRVKATARPAPGSPGDIMSQAFWRERLWLERRGQVTFAPREIVANPFDGTVAIPADLDLGSFRAYIVCDDIQPEPAARVTVNGEYAGGFIERPLRLDITRSLKPGANTIRLDPFMPTNPRVEIFPK